MKQWLNDLLTEADGQSIDVTIVMGLASLAVLLALTVYVVVKQGKEFSILDFGTATAALIAGTGAGARLRPQAPINNKNEEE